MNYNDWIKELDAEEKAHKKYRQRAKKVIKRYKDEEERSDKRFNILWSNTETLHSALYSNTPKPDVSRRFKDKDPISRDIADVLERGLAFGIDSYDFDGNIDSVVNDYLVPGLGQVRLRYNAYFTKGSPQRLSVTMTDEGGMTEDGEPVEEKDIQFDPLPYTLGDAQDELAYQEVVCESVPWDRFKWQPAKRWEDSMWACIDHFMTKEELDEQFPEDADEIPLQYTEDGCKTEEEDGKTRALIHEIFDKKNRKVVVLARGYTEILSEEDDPLNLKDFYPFPRPLMANFTSETLVPIPDFLFYQDLAEEIDILTTRIQKVTEQIKYRGVYDGSFKSLQGVSSADDGEFIPIDDFSERFPDGRSFDIAIKSMPLDDLQKVLVSLYNAREQAKQSIYEITGISDIIRGATKATETATAQQIKGQYANLRLERRRRQIARFVRDIFRINAEILAEHFEPDTLTLMTGIDVSQQMLEVMRSDVMRSYKIDVESDSTVAQDSAEEQKARNDVTQMIMGYLTEAAPLIMQKIIPPDFAKELMLFAIKGYKRGRQLEDAIESLGQQPMQPQQSGIQPPMQPPETQQPPAQPPQMQMVK